MIGCDLSLQVSLLDCDGDRECEQAAFENYESCMSECGFEIPDFPEPDPCLSDCDRLLNEGFEACINEVGELDEECWLANDRRYVECLESCGIEIPEIPEIPDDPCITDCEGAYNEAFLACFDEDTGAVDEECVANTDRTFITCLEGCGIVMPDEPDFPEAPGGPCVNECLENVAEKFAECFQADGMIDEECLGRLDAEAQACVDACEAGDEDHALVAAIARGNSQVPFLRGDANRDSAIDLSDAVAVLGDLFLGSDPLGCRDAADANDDGTVNISDPVAVLMMLFAGGAPLPPPSGEPGSDPTEDELSCRR